MKFDDVGKKYKSVYIDSEENFQQFCNDFYVIGVNWSQPTSISASYFLRVLKKGSSERARGYGRHFHDDDDDDEPSTKMTEYYTELLDHGALWRLEDGSVICTAMPYGTKKSIINSFEERDEIVG